MSRPISTLEYRHSKRELLLYGLLLVGSCVAGYALEQWRHDAAMERMWDAAERRGQAERVYDGPFDQTPTRRWKDGQTP